MKSGSKKLQKLIHQLQTLPKVIQQDVPEIIGQEAENHFTENFARQGFDGQPWKDVKRRDPNSTWYGHKHGAKSKPPSNHPKRKGAVRPYKARKSGAITNYSPTATKSPILSSQNSELERSLSYEVTPGKVSIKSDKKYAAVHNDGGMVKVYGRKVVNIIPRPFVGDSAMLRKKLFKDIDLRVRKHFKNN